VLIVALLSLCERARYENEDHHRSLIDARAHFSLSGVAVFNVVRYISTVQCVSIRGSH